MFRPWAGVTAQGETTNSPSKDPQPGDPAAEGTPLTEDPTPGDFGTGAATGIEGKGPTIERGENTGSAENRTGDGFGLREDRFGEDQGDLLGGTPAENTAKEKNKKRRVPLCTPVAEGGVATITAVVRGGLVQEVRQSFLGRNTVRLF